MTTLSNRLTPRQAMVMRMIEGSIRDAVNAHPDWNFDPRFVKSIAKRATGTLTSQWGDVLALSARKSEALPGLASEAGGSQRLAAPAPVVESRGSSPSEGAALVGSGPNPVQPTALGDV
jgi:hypothetical protein